MSTFEMPHWAYSFLMYLLLMGSPTLANYQHKANIGFYLDDEYRPTPTSPMFNVVMAPARLDTPTRSQKEPSQSSSVIMSSASTLGKEYDGKKEFGFENKNDLDHHSTKSRNGTVKSKGNVGYYLNGMPGSTYIKGSYVTDNQATAQNIKPTETPLVNYYGNMPGSYGNNGQMNVNYGVGSYYNGNQGTYDQNKYNNYQGYGGVYQSYGRPVYKDGYDYFYDEYQNYLKGESYDRGDYESKSIINRMGNYISSMFYEPGSVAVTAAAFSLGALVLNLILVATNRTGGRKRRDVQLDVGGVYTLAETVNVLFHELLDSDGTIVCKWKKENCEQHRMIPAIGMNPTMKMQTFWMQRHFFQHQHKCDTIFRKCLKEFSSTKNHRQANEPMAEPIAPT